MFEGVFFDIDIEIEVENLVDGILVDESIVVACRDVDVE